MEIDETVRRGVEQRRHQLPFLQAISSQDDTSSEEEAVVKKRKKTLKSGRDSTGATSVKKRFTWPHEEIYGSDGHPATYKDLTVSSFVMGYLMVLKDVQAGQVKDHMVLNLEELMEDRDIYSWEKVKSFHAAWMNQVEQQRCD